MIKGPRKLDACDEGDIGEGVADDVADTITSGNVPVGTTCWPEEANVVDASDEAAG